MRACLSVMNDDLARVFERAASSSTTITIEMLEPTRPRITTYVRQAWYLLGITFKEPVPDIELLCDTTELKLGNVSSHDSNLTLAHAMPNMMTRILTTWRLFGNLLLAFNLQLLGGKSHRLERNCKWKSDGGTCPNLRYACQGRQLQSGVSSNRMSDSSVFAQGFVSVFHLTSQIL